MDGFDDAADDSYGIIENTYTKFQVRDVLLSDNTHYVPGITLQILKEKEDGSCEVMTDALNADAKYEWETEPTEHTVYNLPAGTYKLHAVPDTVPGCYRSVADVTFTVNADGTLSVGSSEASGTLNPDKDMLTVFNDTISLDIAKADQFGNSVSGAELTFLGNIWNESNGRAEEQTVTWNTDGTVKTFEGLVRGGEYTLTEKNAPAEHAVIDSVKIEVSEDGNSISVVDSEGNTVELSELPAKDSEDYEVNAPYYQDGTLYVVDAQLRLFLKLQKTDALTGEVISCDGVKFDLYAEGTDTPLLNELEMTDDGDGFFGWDISAVSDTNPLTGESFNKGLKPGKYYLKETAAPAGYALDTDVKICFEFTDKGQLKLLDGTETHAALDGETLKVKNVPLTLRILPCEFDNRIDAGTDGETSLSGLSAAYTVEGLFLNADGSSSVSVRENALMGRLIAGEVYKITESTAPEGYRVQKPVYVKLEADGTAILVDEDGNESSYAYSKALNNTDQTEAAAGKDARILLYHGQTQAYIEKLTSWDAINKELLEDEADYKAFAGVKFTLSGHFPAAVTDGGRLVLKTDASGRISLEGILIDGGTYTLEEAAVPGYIETGAIRFTYNSASQDVITVTENPDAEKVSVENDTLTVRIINDSGQNTAMSFTVIDCTDGSGLAGVQFKLEKKDEQGEYCEVRTLTAEGAGVSYSYVTAGGTETIVTEEGQCFAADLEPGDYRLTQISTVFGYDMAEDDPVTVTFTVDENAMNRVIYIDKDTVDNGSYSMAKEGTPLVTVNGICNKRIAGTVIIEKVDADDTDTAINGVEYTIYRCQENDSIFEKLYSLVTGKTYEVAAGVWTEADTEAGFMEITGLEWGSYYIQETKAASGYKLDDTKYYFEIGRNAGTVVFELTGEKKLENAKIQLSISQFTEDSTAVFRGRMRLTGVFRGSASAASIEWEADGTVYEIAGLFVEGEEYVLEMASAFGGYTGVSSLRLRYNGIGDVTLLSGDDSVQLVLYEDGSVGLEQLLEPTRVSFSATDGNGEVLKNVEMTLYHLKDGVLEELETWVTDGDSHKLVAVLEAGETYVIRTLAPDGYAASEDYSFTVQDTGEWQPVPVVLAAKKPDAQQSQPTSDSRTTESQETDGNQNSEVKLLPKTGREARMIYVIPGILLVAAGIMLIAGSRRKRDEKNKA